MASEVGSLTANIGFKSMAPYLGLGWGYAPKAGKGWAFDADAQDFDMFPVISLGVSYRF